MRKNSFTSEPIYEQQAGKTTKPKHVAHNHFENSSHTLESSGSHFLSPFKLQYHG